jgi:hypothetical protein
MYTDDNYIFQHDSALAHATRSTQEFSKKRKYGEILDPGRLAAIFAKAEPAGLLHLEHLAGKIP